MESSKRLEQAVINLENHFKNGGQGVAKDQGENSSEITTLKAENAALKNTQEQVKKRLDKLIFNIESSEE